MDAELELKLAQIRSDISDLKSALTEQISDQGGTTFNAKQAREMLGLTRYKFHALFDKYDLPGIPHPKTVGVSKVYTMAMIRKMQGAIRGCLD